MVFSAFKDGCETWKVSLVASALSVYLTSAANPMPGAEMRWGALPFCLCRKAEAWSSGLTLSLKGDVGCGSLLPLPFLTSLFLFLGGLRKAG